MQYYFLSRLEPSLGFAVAVAAAAVREVVMVVVIVPVLTRPPLPLARTAPRLLFDLAGAVAGCAVLGPVLLVPRAQRLAAEHEVAVVDHRCHHPVAGAGLVRRVGHCAVCLGRWGMAPRAL